MINGFGPAYGYIGFQVHSRNFFAALDRLELVCLTATNAALSGFTVDAHLRTMTDRSRTICLADLSICIDYASNFHRFAGRCRVGYTVFEYTRLSSEWLNGLRQVDSVWTTSTWGAEVLALNGVDHCPIGIVPEGIDPKIFNASGKATSPRDDTYRFLCVGKWEVRKGQVDLLRAWAKAFSPKDRVELLLMCDNPFVPGFSVEAEIARLGVGKMAPIRVMKPVTTDVEMAKIYAQADCFVLPTRAEGWGLPIMEAMACGTPVITSRYSAMTDYAHDGNAYLLDVKRLVPVHDPLFFPVTGEHGLWAELDQEQLVSLLRQVVSQREESAARGLVAAKEMAANWTWDHAARKAMNLIQKIRPISFVQSSAINTVVPSIKAPEFTATVDLADTLSLVDLMAEAERRSQTDGVPAAIALYREWLATSKAPNRFVARFNLGHLLGQNPELSDEAETVYREAIAEHPGFVQAILNLGSVLERKGKNAEAVAEWQRALVIADAASPPDPAIQIHALNNLGRMLEQLHRYEEAEAMLTRSLAIRPEQDDVLHHWVHLRQKQCCWPVFSPLPGIDVPAMRKATSALAMLSASNDPAEQLDTARRYALAKIPQDLPPLAPVNGYRHDRLRIGYLSSNLNLHAVTILTAEVYELHDRSKIEVYAFCWSPEDGTAMRARIRNAMDHLIRIDTMTDAEAAQAIRAAEIDVLIDLQGLTSGCRPHILAHRPAPVAVSWLGFPGTSAIPGVDYILADRYLIPPEEVAYYSEKPLYLPRCFQANDRKRQIGQIPSRAECQLPQDQFVFCAFNHNHKFNPEMFGVWMRILSRVPQSVLWLLADNEPARLHLTARAETFGVAPARLIFAPRVLPERYLARFAVADLFLDTLPFNGGTTASDALWAGLPVLTCSGRTFASRMAGSLLSSFGLNELVTTTLIEYEERAVSLASNPPVLRGLRMQLKDRRDSAPPFDTPCLVADLEALLIAVAKGVTETV